MNVGGRSLKGSYEGIFAIAMCFFAFVGLIYGWVWWFRIGRRQSAPHTGRPGATLVYSTLLPFAFMFFYPMCSIPEREVLTYSMSGMPLVLIALLLAFWVPRNVRWLFSVYPLLWFGWFVASLPPHSCATSKTVAPPACEPAPILLSPAFM